jgi:threonine/homoserine/homoserine lactone efflux protein
VGSTIGQILGSAVGVAISPVPIIAVILMLFSKRANANGLSFLAGWILGLLVAGTVVLAIDVGASDSGPSTTTGWIKVAIGVLFVGLGIKQWMGRPSGDEEPSMPAWMASIDSFNAIKSFGLGFLLSAANPKNLGLTIAAMATVGSSSLDSSEEFIVLLVFVGIASLTVAAPVLLNLVLGERAKATLDDAKGWLTENNNTVMAVLFVVLGAKVLGDGIAIVA